MKTRKEFPQFLNDLGLKGMGVEVGVAGGEFSKLIAKTWNGQMLLMVDPFTFQQAALDRSDDSVQHEANFRAIKELVRQWRALRRPRKVGVQHLSFLRQYSVETANGYGDGLFDFVYIDARHDYRSVMADLKAWYSKVKKGGVLAGHDYKNSFVRKNLVEVKRAVDDFFFEKERVQSTTEDNLPSWYVIKL